MQIQPRYNADPVLVIEDAGAPSVVLLRQRRRLLALLASLSDQQWANPSRCEEWTTQGVITHMISTDQFWALSIGAGLRGEPTQFLATFDPVASPAEMVRQRSTLTPAEVLAQYRASVDGFAAVLDTIESEQWATVVAEAPPGHIALNATALHALWDGWIHERDILIPLGLTPTEEADEIALILRYAVGLGPAFTRTLGDDQVGVLGVEATEPDLSLRVEVGPTVRVCTGRADGPALRGRAVALIEALSYRAPLVHELGAADAWLVSGLGQIFDHDVHA